MSDWLVPLEDPSALQVRVTVNSTGQQATVVVWENNTAPTWNSVGAPSDFAIANLSYNYCVGGWPLGMGLLQGHYTTANLSEGRFIFPLIFSCTTTSVDIQDFVFSLFRVHLSSCHCVVVV